MKLDKIKDYLYNHKSELLLVLGLALLAYGVFVVTSLTYPNFNEFDPFYQVRIAKTIIQNGGVLPSWDTLTYYPEGMAMLGLYPPLFMYTLTFIYWAVALLTTGSLAFNSDLFFKAISYAIPAFGAFGVVGMYVLGKELRNVRTGLIAALILLFSSGFMYTALFAEAEKDAFGVAWTIWAFAALVWAMKTRSWKRGIVAGLAFVGCMLAWRLSIYVALVAALFVLSQAAFDFFNKREAIIEKTTQMFAAFNLPILIATIVMVTWYVGATGEFKWITDYLHIAFFLPVLLALVLATLKSKPTSLNDNIPILKIKKGDAYKGIIILIAVIAVIALAFKGGQIFDAMNAYFTRASGTVTKLGRTVAEEHAVGFASVLASTYWLAPFLLIALPYLVIRRLGKHGDQNNYDLLVLLYLGSIMYMYINKGKMSYLFTPAMAIGVALVMNDIIGLGESMSVWAKRIAIGIVCIGLFAHIGIGMQVNQQYIQGYSGPQEGWFKALEYIHQQPFNGTVFLTWWDYGHWITYIAERHAVVDNTNVNDTKVMAVARVFTDFDSNGTALAERIKPAIDGWEVSHIGVDRTLLLNKWNALTFLGDNQCISTAKLKERGLTFPTLNELSQTICGPGSTYNGDFGIAPCQKKTVTSDSGKSETTVECTVFKDAPLSLSEPEWAAIKAAKWPGYTLTVGMGTSALKMKVYGTPDNMIMFFHANGRILDDAPVNYMLGPRIFFRDETLPGMSLVQNEFVPNEEVVVYEVNR